MRSSLKVLLPLGVLSLAMLAWRVDVTLVKSALAQVGWGIVLVISQETVAHLLNALGWRFAFADHTAASCSLGELFRFRVAGDAINYLTPSANVAGEVARAAMLRESHRAAASVVVAKAAQTLAQAVFIVTGLCLAGIRLVAGGASRSCVLSAVAGMLLITTVVVSARSRWLCGLLEPTRAWLGAVVHHLLDFVRYHPGRLMLSTLMFVLAYAWGAFEAYWICHFLGSGVSLVTAVLIEVLSVTVDGLLFMVPAKMGTQEGGKMAVFAALGLAPSLGFAFGVVRHVRELTWAGLGVVLCWAHRRQAAGLLA